MVSISVDTKELQAMLRRVGAKASDGREPLYLFYQDWKADVATAWATMRANTGGSFRGEHWAPMKPQYTRKTDGVTVPAWGGVPRVRKGFGKRSEGPRRGVSTGKRTTRVSGVVSGRLRPSGQRVKAQDTINQDTGKTKNDILTGRPDITPARLQIGGNLPEYAPHVLLALGRNPLFFTKTDESKFMRRVRDYWDKLIGGKA